MNVVKSGIAMVRTWIERRRAIDELSMLSDLQLRDIGLERGLIEVAVRDGLPQDSVTYASVSRVKGQVFA